MPDRDEELERLAALVDAIPDPVYRVRADGTFVSVEVPDDHPTAVDQASIPGQTIRGVLPPRQADLLMEGIAEALATGGLVSVEYGLGVDEERRWWEARLVPAGGDVYAIVREITGRRRREAEARRHAHTDALTGLANRAALDEHLDRALARARRDDTHVALLFCDLDRFKAVNDAHGHATGDVVLAQAASRLRHLVRDTDLAVRIGGDELALVLSDVGVDDVAAIAARLVATVSEPYDVAGHEHRIGLSVGIAVHPADGTTGDELLHAADGAMYRAKQAGGNAVRWAGDAGEDSATRRARPGPGPVGSD